MCESLNFWGIAKARPFLFLYEDLVYIHYFKRARSLIDYELDRSERSGVMSSVDRYLTAHIFASFPFLRSLVIVIYVFETRKKKICIKSEAVTIDRGTILLFCISSANDFELRFIYFIRFLMSI